MKTNTFALRALLLTAVWMAAAGPAHAQRAVKLKEINPSVNAASGFPNEFVEVGGVAVFSAVDASDDRELWVTDGTTEGTRKLKDINPGAASSDPEGLTLFNGVVYFSAETPFAGIELWRTDGTEAGTFMVKDIVPGVNGSFPISFTVVGDRLYFSAYLADFGSELWASDGTSAGTQMVKDAVVGTVGITPSSMCAIGGVLYFSATTAASGRELWRSDGTAEGTFMVSDIVAGASSSNPKLEGGLGNLAFFTAVTAASGRELWASDGTAAGTYQVLDILAGSQGALYYGGDAAEYDGYLYFQIQQASSGVDGLWRTDGTPAGTNRIRHLYDSGDLTAYGGFLYFTGSSGTTSQLWRSDGTAAGTIAISSVPYSAVESTAHGLTIAGSTIFFFGSDQVWASNGAPGGAYMVKDILPGVANVSNLQLQRAALGRLFFSATDMVNGHELWMSDGTTAGTLMLKDIRISPNSGSPANFTELNGVVLFAATDVASGRELWKSDGTEAGTVRVKDLTPGSAGASPSKFTRSGNYVYFVGNVTTTLSVLWRTDGTSAGTVVLANYQGTSTLGVPDKLTDVNGTLYFVAANSSSTGVELFRTSGGAPTLVKDLRNFYGSSPNHLAPLGNQLYFGATDNTGYKLFRTDGTAAGTVEATQGSELFGSATSLVNAGSRLYFSAYDAIRGVELWTTDGTSEGTRLVADLHPTLSSSPANLTMVGGVAYFTATDGVSGVELWKTDGTSVGTVQVADLNPGPASSSPAALLASGGRLYFTATDGIGPVTLWSTDGTPGGTTRIRDASSGATLTAPSAMADANGTLIFQASDGVAGAELWSTDGASGFAFQIQDINEGPGSSSPTSIKFTAGRLYFAANDGTNGSELWTLSNQAPVAFAGADQAVDEGVSVTLSGSGSTDPDSDALTFEWRDSNGELLGRGVEISPVLESGEQTITLIVRDGYGGLAMDDVTIAVRPSVDLAIEVSSVREGSGSIAVDANEICAIPPGGVLTCTYSYAVDSVAHLVATPAADSVFGGWTGACASAGTALTCDVSMSEAASVGATFLGPYTLTMEAVSFENGVGSVYVSTGSGVTAQCDAVTGVTTTCTMRVRPGDLVLVGATPHGLSILNSIEGCVADPMDPNGAGCAPITMDVPQTIRTTFRGPQTLTIEAVSFENGLGEAFASNGLGMTLSCPGVAGTTSTCTIPVRVGDAISFSGIPGALSVLNSIVGCVADPFDPSGAGCFPPLVVTGPKTISATFQGPQSLGISFAGDGTGEVIVTSVGTCVNAQTTCAFPTRVGTVQQIEAMPSADSLFVSWGGACAGQGPVCSVTISDDANTQANFVLRNHPPIANAGGPYTGVRNQAIVFSGAASTDPEPDTLTYSWDFGDGSPAGTGIAPTHAYTSTGTFTVTLTVNDGTVNSTAATATVTISNQAPTANAGGPYSAVRNQVIAFSGAASNDPDGDTLAYSWDFGDGTPAGAGVAPTHAYTNAGTFAVTLTVNDGTVNSTAATATVTISNQAPTANAGGPYAGVRNQAITFSGAASNDPDGDTLTYSWDFGDGGVATGPTPTHLYAATGTFTVTLTVNDGTTNSAPATSTVTITNVTPTVALTGPGSGAVFHAPASVTVSADAADADGGVAKVEFYAGAVKIGEALGAPYQVLWPATVPGAYTLTAVVTDSSGATVGSVPVNVLVNAPPTVALTSPVDNAQFASPASITLTASAADGDGTIAQVQFFRGATSLGIDNTAPYSVTWTGATIGSYQLTAVAVDNRGAIVTSAPISVKVTATLAFTDDSYVRASSSNSSFGTATELTVQQGNSNSNIRWTYVKFDLSTIPTVTNAKVRLFGRVSATTTTAINTAAYSVVDTSWTETGIKWSNKPATGTTALTTVAIVNNSTTARWYEFDVTAHLQAEKAAGRNVVTLAFKNLANSTPYVTFASRQGTAANRPQVLVVP